MYIPNIIRPTYVAKSRFFLPLSSHYIRTYIRVYLLSLSRPATENSVYMVGNNPHVSKMIIITLTSPCGYRLYNRRFRTILSIHRIRGD